MDSGRSGVATGREQSGARAGAGAVRPPNRTGVDFCWALKPQEEPNKLLHGQIRPVVFKVLFNGLGILLRKKKKLLLPSLLSLLSLLLRPPHPPTALLGDCLALSAPTGTQALR